MRILIRTSKWATAARRLGWLSLPLTLVPVLMHREGFLDSRTFLVVAGFACLMALLAVLTAFIALARLWHTGDQGWNRALTGLFLGFLCLLPFAWYGSLALRHPQVTDISTVPRGELPLTFEPDTATMPPSRMLSPEEQALYFPNATTRTYPLEAFQLFAIVQHVVEEQGWDVRQSVEPDIDGTPGRINARIVTIPGWREEAVLRVTPTPGGGVVDMRSASIGAPHDLGSNGERISAFLALLDDQVTAFLRDNPNTNQPTPTELEEPAPEVETGG